MATLTELPRTITSRGALLNVTNSARPRAVLYIRLSKESAASTSIAGQNDDLRVIAERNGWDVVAVFEDSGKSGGKERANANAAYELWRDGEADILAVYAYDRWSRMGIKTLAALIEVVDARAKHDRPATFIAVREGIESTQPDWQLRAAFAADMAKRERDLVAARQVAARDRMRRQGRNAGHGVPPFGYRTGPHPTLPVGRGLHVREAERAVVLEVANRIRQGESFVRIAENLTARRVPTARSAARIAELAHSAHERGESVDPQLLKADPDALDHGRWTPSRIRTTWSSDHLLGRLSHNGEPVYDAEGQPLTPFEAILTLDEIQAIRERCARTPQGRPSRRPGAALLSRIAFCSGCGKPLYRRMSGANGGYPNYSCSSSAYGVECPHRVSISGRKLEAELTRRFLQVAGSWPELRQSEIVVGAHLRAELAEVDARLKELGDRLVLADDDSEDERIQALMAPLKVRRRMLRETTPSRTETLTPTGRTMADVWEGTDDAEARRMLIVRALDHIEILPSRDENGALIRERFVFYWKPSPEDAPEYFGL
ncbi:recombinase family protein [Microbacterium sp. USTB-Y]|uniref:recombinase family protein n=1 Tax=Microbacterium sp. USTB-Y TaxID=2823692 RepID=UPI00203D924A|nr:recombinase family protein [Microbacterium sp. USTB-Y]